MRTKTSHPMSCMATPQAWRWLAIGNNCGQRSVTQTAIMTKTVASRPYRLSGRSGSSTHGTNLSDPSRSEEHTSELQSRENLVCRLLLDKKKPTQTRREAA